MKQVIKQIAEQFDATQKDAKEVLEFAFEKIADVVVAEGKLRVSGLGTFTVVDKPARVARNPKTGEAVNVPAKKVVKFKPSTEFNTKLQ